MASATSWPLRVYYDGACPICSREMGIYRNRDRFHRIEWVDIAKADFDAAAEGLDPARVHQMMHARTADGKVFTQVAAFVKIWEALPLSPFTAVLRGLLKVPGMMWLAGIFYRLFARNRYRLTGRCTADSCHIRQASSSRGA